MRARVIQDQFGEAVRGDFELEYIFDSRVASIQLDFGNDDAGLGPHRSDCSNKPTYRDLSRNS